MATGRSTWSDADGATLDVYLDGSSRSLFEMEGAQSGGAVIDFNSDGYSDLIALVENSLRVFPGGPVRGGAAAGRPDHPHRASSGR